MSLVRTSTSKVIEPKNKTRGRKTTLQKIRLLELTRIIIFAAKQKSFPLGLVIGFRKR